MNLQEFKGTFNEQLGLNIKALLEELDALAAKLGITDGMPLSAEFMLRAKHIYEAYLAQVSADIATKGWDEFKNLLLTGRTPKRPKRVGASTA